MKTLKLGTKTRTIDIDPCGMHEPGDGSWWANDARGIPLKRVCDRCEKFKLAGFRADVLTDPNYWHDEPIDEE
jgi:hypothetical protein